MHGAQMPALAVAQSVSEATLSPRLVSASHEFEAAMMKELIAPLEQGNDLAGDGDDGEGSASAITSFAGEALGKAISEHGGLGIAKRILHQLAREGNHSGNTIGSKNLIETTSNSSRKSLR